MTNSTDQELLPCPFCGDPSPNLTHDDYVHEDGRPMAVVECTKCHTWVQAEAWNKRASLQPAGVAVPKGWKLVPVEPTPAILDAIDLLCDDHRAFEDSDSFWRYLLAADQHPVSGEQSVDRHNSAYWKEQYELLRKDYQRSLDERAQDVAGLVEALDYCEKWFLKHSPTAPLIGGYGDAEHPMLLTIQSALAAHRAHQGEPNS